jgi:isoaspartyl peptidase/L-asparaginase-like protein (Ntn-hydrolase superfamily)
MCSYIHAVEVAVRSLEDDPVFNAGCGSSLNKAGDVEMDAIIADGRELQLLYTHVHCNDRLVLWGFFTRV